MQSAVQKLSAAGVAVTYVDLQNILTPDDIGCDGHPSVSGHTKMFNKMAPVISQVMHWQ